MHSRRIRFLEDEAAALKHVAILTIYKILFIYKYIYCAVVGLDKKLYKMHGTYIKINDECRLDVWYWEY